MFTAALILLSPTANDAREFFPLDPGTLFVYTESTGALKLQVTDEVEAEAEVGNLRGVPVTTRVEGQRTGTVFYRVEADTVTIIAFEPKAPLAAPYPILKVPGARPVSWRHTGQMPVMGMMGQLTLTGTSRLLRERDVLGKKVPAIEVKLDATIEMPTGGRMKSVQTAVYARGFGLVESRETATFGRDRTVRTRTLTEMRKK